MEIIFVMKRMMYLITEWKEILRPAQTGSKIGINGIKLKLNIFRQAIKHGIYHIIHFYKETTVHTYVINHLPGKGFIDSTIRFYI